MLLIGSINRRVLNGMKEEKNKNSDERKNYLRLSCRPQNLRSMIIWSLQRKLFTKARIKFQDVELLLNYTTVSIVHFEIGKIQ